MQKYVVNAMSGFLEVIMWITFIGSAIFGLIAGKEAKGFIGLVIGLILGACAGFVLNILTWGTISLVMEIRNYLKEIAEWNIPAILQEVAERKTVVPVTAPKAVPVAAPAVASATIPTESAKKDVPEKLNADFLR